MYDSDEQFQAPDPNLAAVMYVMIVDDSTLALVDVNICARNYLWMVCALYSPSCCLTMDVSLSVRRVFVKTAYMNIFFRSNNFVSLIDPGL